MSERQPTYRSDIEYRSFGRRQKSMQSGGLARRLPQDDMSGIAQRERASSSSTFSLIFFIRPLRESGDGPRYTDHNRRSWELSGHARPGAGQLVGGVHFRRERQELSSSTSVPSAALARWRGVSAGLGATAAGGRTCGGSVDFAAWTRSRSTRSRSRSGSRRRGSGFTRSAPAALRCSAPSSAARPARTATWTSSSSSTP